MNRPWMPLYIGDYLADTAHLRAAESGAYLHLIMHYWRHGALPQDDALLAAIAKMTSEEWARARPLIEPLFKDGWKHKRIDAELTKAVHRTEAARSAGQASGRVRAQTNVRSTDVERTLNETPTLPVIVVVQEEQPPQTTEKESPQSEFEEVKSSGVTRARPGCRLPADFALTQERINFALTQLPESRIPIEFDKFRDHWAASSGRNAVKRDWDAAWRNWCRKAIEDRNAQTTQRNLTVVPGGRENFATFAMRYAKAAGDR